MGAYKDLYMGIQELVWTAIELGTRDFDNIYAYVYMYESRADRETVRAIVDEIAIDDEYLLSVA